jgi:crescentin
MAMRNISDFLVRKGVPSTPAAFQVRAPSQQQGLIAAENHGEQTFADLGARVGEGNETLRNLLLDTDRRLLALDDLKEAFRNLVEPIGSALQTLEQEKTDNVALRNSLAELRASHEILRAESLAFERKAVGSENDNENLRHQLAVAQQTARELESDKADLTSDLIDARSEIANLTSQLAQESANGRALAQANQILADHGSAADKRIVELQGEGGLAREQALLLEDDKSSLQAALEQTLAESARLSRRLAESDGALTAARARLEQTEVSLAESENERAALSAARDEANERHQSESYALNLRLEALRSRAATAEKLLTEVRQSLVGRTEDIRAAERKAVEASITRNATEKTVERLSTARDVLDAKVKELEQARAALTQRSNGLSESLKAREISLVHAEQKIKALSDRVEQLERDAGAYRSKAEKRIDDLSQTLQRERVELGVARGALETTRRDYARLQRERLPERPVEQASAALDQIPEPAESKEPAKSKNGRSGGPALKAVETEPGGAGPESTSPR